MTMKREDYVAQGRHDAERGLKPAVHREGSWQWSAYRDGYESYIAKVQHRTDNDSTLIPQSIIIQLTKHVAHWPEAAHAHAKFLAAEVAKERNTARRNRLIKALERMAKRHDPHQVHQDRDQRVGAR